MAKNICPICGRHCDDVEMDFLDNGNPACFSCVQKELQREESQKKTKEEQSSIVVQKIN